MVLFGSKDGVDQVDNIFIYSVRDKAFTKSKMQCPMTGHIQSFAINDRMKDEIITLGYLRSRWKQCGMNNHLFPPQYLT